MTDHALLEQLYCIVNYSPLWPGDTLSHGLADECERRGWSIRAAEGYWIPTAAGVIALGDWKP